MGVRRFQRGIQKRKDQFDFRCPKGCGACLHGHGSYERYWHPERHDQVSVQRYRCSLCGLTISVLEAYLLPYRPIPVDRLEGFFDGQAGINDGLDPPPGALEEDCLRRAWLRLSTRTSRLQEVLGQLLPAFTKSPQALWLGLRRSLSSLRAILRDLAELGNTSLLGDYRCLRPP